jgi:alginate O-acetyltransferase complex protein AlgI
MTRSRFLKDYLYIPLGGNRHGSNRRYVYLLVTMLLGGLWHGAGWTFIIWGGLHGSYLIINHTWHRVPAQYRTLLPRSGAWALTFLCVVVAWVVFRATSLSEAGAMLGAMFGTNGLAVPVPIAHFLTPLLGDVVQAGGTFGNALFEARTAVPMIALALAIVVLCPNSQEIMARYRPALSEQPIFRSRLSWRPTKTWGGVVGVCTALSISMMGGDSPFLYFRF